jgi:hypothetical protein
MVVIPPTCRAAQLLQRITDSRQQGGPIRTSLHPRRYRIQPSPATHGTDLTDPQRLVVARDTLSPGVRLRALPPSPRGDGPSGGHDRGPMPR